MRMRGMLPKDRDAVIDMMRVFYKSEAVMTNGSQEIFENDVNACVSDNPYAEGFVFENTDSTNNEPAGYAMLAKSFSTEFGKQCIWIEDLYIKPQFRSMGIGKKFFEELFLLYPNAVFRLEAEKENKKAIYVYQKCGFEEIPYFEMIKK